MPGNKRDDDDDDSELYHGERGGIMSTTSVQLKMIYRVHHACGERGPPTKAVL